MSDNNLAGWEVAQARAQELTRRANELELLAGQDGSLAKEARQAKHKAIVDTQDAKLAWERAQVTLQLLCVARFFASSQPRLAFVSKYYACLVLTIALYHY